MTEAELRKEAAEHFAAGVERERVRLTPTERLHEVTMATLQRASSPPEHSVTISRNAKGVVQLEITVRGFDLDGVAVDAMGAFGVLEAAYPYLVNGASE